MANKRYGMVIETKRCIGCHTCSVACKLENNEPDGVWWNRVLTVGGESMDTPAGVFPNVQMGFVTLGCQHCENPACVKVCPVGATWKDEATGIVMQDPDKCLGCRYCMVACPYNGVRQFNFEEPQFATGFPVGSVDAMVHQKNTVEKCTLCAHRVAKGEEPACINVCPGRARHFGDFNDPESEVSKLIRTRAYFRLLEEKGTEPSIYFLT
jgi:molybdopterin-containing oxidoreductase family iron-sulfur binding subunit